MIMFTSQNRELWFRSNRGRKIKEKDNKLKPYFPFNKKGEYGKP